MSAWNGAGSSSRPTCGPSGCEESRVRDADRTRVLETWLELVRDHSRTARSERALRTWGQALVEAMDRFLHGHRSAIEEAALDFIKSTPAGPITEPLQLLLLFRRAVLRVFPDLPTPQREELDEAFDQAALVLAAWCDGKGLPPQPVPLPRAFKLEAFGVGSFHLILPLEVQRALRYGRALSLMLVSLDAYEDLFERHGPAVAEGAVEALLELMNRTLRATDTRYRIGPDRIAVLLPETGPEEALVAAERVREQAASGGPIEVDPEHSYSLHLTVGIASCPTHATEAEALLKAAEQALADACRMGGNLALVYRS